MAHMGRPGLSDSQKRELWNMWVTGCSISEIGRVLERKPGSIFGVLAARGGIRPVERRRSRHALTSHEREQISRGIASGLSVRSIARSIRRSASTISREIARNGGRARYRAIKAEDRALEMGLRPKPCVLAANAKLRNTVARKLQLQWSPEQISGWLKRTYPLELSMQVSHETIYRSLFIQARGVLRKELMQHLRTNRVMRRGKRSTIKGQARGSIVDAVTIRERPAEVEDRAIPGHWEGDLLSGSNNSHIATLVERTSRFTMLVKLTGKDAVTVTTALKRAIGRLPQHIRQSLTWDRGPELAAHKCLSVSANIDIYFCDPQSPWQRGSNENTNRLVRQYLPKGTDISHFKQSQLNQIALRLNQRPRKTLNYKTPAEVYSAYVAMID
jgi:IS30 family transposase